jgi:hypothetical protein
MNYLKVEAIMEIDETCFPLDDKEDLQYFLDILNDKEQTRLMVFSNDLGDEVCITNDFKWKIFTELK